MSDRKGDWPKESVRQSHTGKVAVKWRHDKQDNKMCPSECDFSKAQSYLLIQLADWLKLTLVSKPATYSPPKSFLQEEEMRASLT